MRAGVTDPELVNHFTVAIYPFVHGLTGKGTAPRLEALEGRWRPWWSRLNDDQLAGALEASAFFLPYVRGLLYPETALLQDEPPGERYGTWVRRIREITEPGRFCRALPPHPVLHLTCGPAVLDALSAFTVPPSRRSANRAAHGELSARLDWVDAVLFPSGLGFLLLQARLASGQPRLSQLIRLNQALRQVLPPTLDWELPVLRLRATGHALRLRDLIDLLVRGLAAGPVGLYYTDTAAGRAHSERCQLLSYACAPLNELERSRLEKGVFPTGMERLLFEFAACIGLGETVHNPMWVPSQRQAERLCRDHGLALWHSWQAMALKEHLAFLATEDLAFTRRTLPRTVEQDYLPLYVYALYQKFQLSLFANDLMREVAQVEGHLRGARALMRRFVAFRNRFWFSEVTQKPQGGDLYRAIQQGLEVPALYQMVTASVKDAKEYYEDRWDRQVRLVLTGLGLASGPVAVGCGLAQSLWSALGPVWTVALILLGLTVGVVSLLGLLKERPGRRRRPAARRGPLRIADWVRTAFSRGRRPAEVE